MKNMIRSAMLLAAFALSTSASALTVYSGTVSGPGAWGFVDFSHSGGNLNIDGRSNGWTGGLTGQGVDDMFLTLLVNDGSSKNAFTGALVASNDDSASTFGDGSTTSLDSFINALGLAAGNYTLAISHCCTNFGAVRNASVGSGIHDAYLDYQITFSQNVSMGVPEPASALLVALGLVGAGVFGRKRISK